MADTIYTVTVPELPVIAQVTGEEQVAVYRDNRLGRISQAALRGTRTLSGPTTPPVEPSVLMALVPVLGDRWRNTATGDEWKITALQPSVVWMPDGNVKGADGVSDTPGPPGEPGRKGDKGEPGKLALVQALVPISADTVVVSVGAGGCIPADPSNPSHCGRVLGIVHQATPANGTASVQSAGELNSVAGNFGAQAPLFIAANGSLTATAPTSGWRQQVGVASSANRIVINLGLAYRLQDAASLLIQPGDDAIAALLLAALTPSVLQIAHARWVATLSPLPANDADIPDAGGWYLTNGQPFLVPPKA